MFSFPIRLIGVILWLNVYLASAAITSYENVLEFEAISTKQYYFKVPQSLPTSVKEDTFLSSTSFPNTRVSLKYICLLMCKADPDCALACFNETTCTTYFALIADYWKPSPSDMLETFTEKCYSNWKFHHDITSQILTVASTTPYETSIPQNSLSGIYTIKNDYTFRSLALFDPVILFDFGKAVKITKVIVKTRNNTGLSTYFQDVELRIDMMIVDNCCSTPAPAGSVIVFTGEQPWFGRHIILRNKDGAENLVVAEIKFIG